MIHPQHLRLHDPALSLKDYKRMFPGVPTVSETLRLYHQDQRIDQLGGDLKWTRKAVLALFRRETRSRGRQPRKWEWNQGNRPGSKTIRTLFGSWNAMVAEAGGTPVLRGGGPFQITKHCPRGHLRAKRPCGKWYCPECAREIDRRGRRRRSEVAASLRTGEWLACPVCGKVFYAQRSAITQGRKTCSYDCAVVNRTLKLTPKVVGEPEH
jgi:uncharacterized C2H2 Zn-finger protein